MDFLFGNLNQFSNSFRNILPSLIPVPIIIWSLFWKGLALWQAARNEQRNWFVAILVLNTLGILEIVYLFGFAKNKLKLNLLEKFHNLQLEKILNKYLKTKIK